MSNNNSRQDLVLKVIHCDEISTEYKHMNTQRRENAQSHLDQKKSVQISLLYDFFERYKMDKEEKIFVIGHEKLSNYQLYLKIRELRIFRDFLIRQAIFVNFEDLYYLPAFKEFYKRSKTAIDMIDELLLPTISYYQNTKIGQKDTMTSKNEKLIMIQNTIDGIISFSKKKDFKNSSYAKLILSRKAELKSRFFAEKILNLLNKFQLNYIDWKKQNYEFLKLIILAPIKLNAFKMKRIGGDRIKSYNKRNKTYLKKIEPFTRNILLREGIDIEELFFKEQILQEEFLKIKSNQHSMYCVQVIQELYATDMDYIIEIYSHFFATCPADYKEYKRSGFMKYFMNFLNTTNKTEKGKKFKYCYLQKVNSLNLYIENLIYIPEFSNDIFYEIKKGLNKD